MDAGGAEDVKSDVLKLLGKPQSRFSTATTPIARYAIAISSSWSLAAESGASRRFIDSTLK